MPEIVPFDRFIAAVAEARPEQYADDLEAGARAAGVTLETARAEFERMKKYLLSHYEGVHPVGSFLDSNGQTIDCVPFEQQPTVRAAIKRGIKVPRPAPRPLPASAPKPVCPEGTVPMLRITLQQLARHGTLDHFFHKLPGGRAQK